MRLPKKIREQLEAEALAQDRSMSWLVLACIKEQLPRLKRSASFNQADRQPVGSLN